MIHVTTAVDHIYQSSDLAGSRRKEIVEAAQRGTALLRAPSGDALAFLPQEGRPLPLTSLIGGRAQ